MAEPGYSARRNQALRDSVRNNVRETAMYGSGGAAAITAAAGAGAPQGVVGVVAAGAIATTGAKMLRDAVRAVRQQPRESAQTLQNTMATAGRNPQSPAAVRGLARSAGDIKRLDRAYGGLEKANDTLKRTTGTADRRHGKRTVAVDKLRGKVDKLRNNKVKRAENRTEAQTKGVNDYLRGS